MYELGVVAIVLTIHATVIVIRSVTVFCGFEITVLFSACKY